MFSPCPGATSWWLNTSLSSLCVTLPPALPNIQCQVSHLGLEIVTITSHHITSHHITSVRKITFSLGGGRMAWRGVGEWEGHSHLSSHLLTFHCMEMARWWVGVLFYQHSLTDLITQGVIYMKMSFVDADEVRPDPVGISGSNIHQTDDLTMNYWGGEKLQGYEHEHHISGR